MASARPELIEALYATARMLEKANDYQWGHMGACNCGFLARQVTTRSREEIHNRALLRCGDWLEQLNDYCPDSGLPMDELIDLLISFGFSLADLKHLERLSDEKVLARLPGGKRHLYYNVKDDVMLYLRTWASMLEDEWLQKTTLPLVEETSIAFP